MATYLYSFEKLIFSRELPGLPHMSWSVLGNQVRPSSAVIGPDLDLACDWSGAQLWVSTVDTQYCLWPGHCCTYVTSLSPVLETVERKVIPVCLFSRLSSCSLYFRYRRDNWGLAQLKTEIIQTSLFHCWGWKTLQASLTWNICK